MALISVLIGGMFGFISFLLAMTVFNTGFLWALAIYSGTGITIALAMIAMGLASRTLASTSMATAQHAEG